MDLIVAGHPNKRISARLNVSVRTIEARQAAIYRKPQTNCVAEPVRLVCELEVCELERPVVTGDANCRMLLFNAYRVRQLHSNHPTRLLEKAHARTRRPTLGALGGP